MTTINNAFYNIDKKIFTIALRSTNDVPINF